MVNVRKLSQISPGTPGNTDQIVGVTGGSVDALYTIDDVLALSGSVASSVLTPRQFGAFGDPSNQHPITQTDINNNPQWIRAYGVGTTWDSVGIQECIYACFATNSTPGNVVWNSVVNTTYLNKIFFCPPGVYSVNVGLVLLASGFEFDFAGRNQNTIWNFYGAYRVTGNSHTSTTIDGINSTALLDLVNPTFIQGPGVPPGTYITAVGPNSITLSAATTSSLTSQPFYIFTSMLYCNSVSYGVFRNVTMGTQVALPRASYRDATNPYNLPVVDYYGSFTALWVIDHSATSPGGIDAAQISIYDTVLGGLNIADVGLSISPTGFEGATISLLNPQVSSFNVAGISQDGTNALGNVIYNGDFIGNLWFSVLSRAGSFSCNNATFEAQQPVLQEAPQIGQVQNFGSDFFYGPGSGPNAISTITGVRSESSCLAQASGVALFVDNCASLNGGQGDWFASFGGFQLGTVIFPNVNNNRNRSFILVDTGGTNTWNSMTPNFTPSDTIIDPSANYTPNSLVGLQLWFRISSFSTVRYTITANTATTITCGGVGAPFVPSVLSLYTVGGATGASEPDWDSAPDGTVADFWSGPLGITLTAGSTSASGAPIASPNNGDYIVVGRGDSVGAPVWENSFPPVICPFIARASNVSGFNFTVSKPPARSTIAAFCYVGAGITDGAVTWLNVDYNGVLGAAGINLYQLAFGARIGSSSNMTAISSARPDWYRGDTSPVGQNYGAVGTGQVATALTVALNATQATLDITPYVTHGNFSQLTPTQSMTLNAPVPFPNAAQIWNLEIITSGTVSYTITFGANMRSTGTLATGVTSGAILNIMFISDGTTWNEITRSAAV